MATQLFRTYSIVQDAPGLTSAEIASLAEFPDVGMASRNLYTLRLDEHVRREKNSKGSYVWFATDKIFVPKPELHPRKCKGREAQQTVETPPIKPSGDLVVEHVVRLTFRGTEIVITREMFDALMSLTK